MAIILFSLVSHTADVKCLFSNLGGIQGVQQSQLTVRTFETLGRLHCHYTSLLCNDIERKGQTWRRTQAHTHTHKGGGINTELAIVIKKELTIRLVLTSLLSGEQDFWRALPGDTGAIAWLGPTCGVSGRIPQSYQALISRLACV